MKKEIYKGVQGDARRQFGKGITPAIKVWELIPEGSMTTDSFCILAQDGELYLFAAGRGFQDAWFGARISEEMSREIQAGKYKNVELREYLLNA